MEMLILELMVFAVGTVIGSFLNVCIFRIPQREDIVHTRSHCLYCKAVLKWYELIPVVSFAVQKGRCRSCGKRLSLQYLVVEVANGFLYLLILCVAGWQPVSILYGLCASALLVLSVIDYRTYEIPAGCTLFIGVLGVARLFLDLPGWKGYVIGLFAVSGLFFALYLMTGGKGIGGGDIKLMAAAGLLLGWKNILLALMVGSAAGLGVQGFMLWKKKKDHRFAFGPYLAVGIFCAMLWGEELISFLYLKY